MSKHLAFTSHSNLYGMCSVFCINMQPIVWFFIMLFSIGWMAKLVSLSVEYLCCWYARNHHVAHIEENNTKDKSNWMRNESRATPYCFSSFSLIWPFYDFTSLERTFISSFSGFGALHLFALIVASLDVFITFAVARLCQRHLTVLHVSSIRKYLCMVCVCV